MTRYDPPGPALYPECGGLTGYKKHTELGTVTCARCREAARVGEARYRKDRYLYGPRKVPALGARRRVQALAAIGWTFGELGARLTPPVTSEAIGKLLKHDVTYRDKAEQIARLYDELWDQPRAGTQGAARSRNRALRDGWLPPMAWDDDRLDDPAYVPLDQVLRDWDAALVEHRDRCKRAARSARRKDSDVLAQERARKRRWRDRQQGGVAA